MAAGVRLGSVTDLNRDHGISLLRAINRHAAVAELIPKTKRYEDEPALERGVARVMSAPAKSYALAVVSFNAASTRCR
jgi:hypothetical protein